MFTKPSLPEPKLDDFEKLKHIILYVRINDEMKQLLPQYTSVLSSLETHNLKFSPSSFIIGSVSAFKRYIDGIYDIPEETIALNQEEWNAIHALENSLHSYNPELFTRTHIIQNSSASMGTFSLEILLKEEFLNYYDINTYLSDNDLDLDLSGYDLTFVERMSNIKHHIEMGKLYKKYINKQLYYTVTLDVPNELYYKILEKHLGVGRVFAAIPRRYFLSFSVETSNDNNKRITITLNNWQWESLKSILPNKYKKCFPKS